MPVTTEILPGVAIVTIDFPEKRNRRLDSTSAP
jgi:hypothetical protein